MKQEKITLKELRERGFDTNSVEPARGEIALVLYDDAGKYKYCSCGALPYLQNALISIAKEDQDAYDLIVTTAVELTSSAQDDIDQ